MKASILYGSLATSLERTACEDLKKDIESVTDFEVELMEEAQNYKKEGYVFIVGSPDTCSLIAQFMSKKILPITKENPGKRGGCIQIIERENAEPIIILAGSDDQGAQYALYDFSRDYLGIDPFNYWTGYTPKKIENFDSVKLESKIIPAPVVPILAYFDNDNDELANMTKPYLEFSFENWKQVIDTLVRLRYNAIDIHDHLGRAEFYRWPFYKDLVPDYNPNTELLYQVIDYAHSKGVLIQVSFYLGWKFKTISDKANLNYAKYKEEWFEVWKYYLEETPIGKCDIFLNRPRDQKWDRRYKGADYQETAVLFTEVFSEMRNILKEHNPNAIIIGDLYSEGMKVWAEGFEPTPKEDFIMAWPDNGFGRINNVPNDFRGYKFGIYVHAGFFLNHVVMDPYPVLLHEEMKKTISDKGMTNYCLVNGQTFRHYLLNLEACSDICMNPEAFDPEKFYLDWCARYFGEEAAENIVKIYKMLHEAQIGRQGYVKVLGRSKVSVLRLRLLKYLKLIPRKWILKIVENTSECGPSFTEDIKKSLPLLNQAYKLAQETEAKVKDEQFMYHDHVLLPLKLIIQVNKLMLELQLAAYDYKDGKHKEHMNNAIKYLEEHTKTRLEGDKNSQWATWYDPAKRRPNGGYPDINLLKKL